MSAVNCSWHLNAEENAFLKIIYTPKKLSLVFKAEMVLFGMINFVFEKI